MASNLYYPESLRNALNESWEDDTAVSAVKFDIYNRPESGISQIHRSIYLYMPETLSNPTNVSWDSQATGPGGAEHVDSASYLNFSNLAKSFQEDLNGFMSSMRGKLSGGTQADGETLLALQERKMRNPFLKMVFRGHNFRNFEYLFKFTPANEQESNTIFEIVQEFRAASLPASTPGGEMGGTPDPNAFKVEYPKEIQIEYEYQGAPHKWLNKFKHCVITDMNVNYTGAGFYAPMRNGFPAQTELRLQFSEIDLVYREDLTPEGPSF